MDIIVGIDVSKDRLDVHVMPSGDCFFVCNDHAGIDELASRLRSDGADVVALEATGGFENLAVAGLSGAGLAVIVVNPAQVRAYANALVWIRFGMTKCVGAARNPKLSLPTHPDWLRDHPALHPGTIALDEPCLICQKPHGTRLPLSIERGRAVD